MKIQEIEIINADSDICYKGTITKMPLADELIIQKSIEYFSDEAPCFIHRSAVMKRLYFELEEYLLSTTDHGNNEISIDILPDGIRDILRIHNNYSHIRVVSNASY